MQIAFEKYKIIKNKYHIIFFARNSLIPYVFELDYIGTELICNVSLPEDKMELIRKKMQSIYGPAPFEKGSVKEIFKNNKLIYVD